MVLFASTTSSRTKGTNASIRRIVQTLLIAATIIAIPLLCSAKSELKLTDAQLSEKISHYLQSDVHLSFRDITPPYVSEGFRHLQQTYNGQDLHQSVIAIHLDKDGNIKQLFGDVFEGVDPQQKNSENTGLLSPLTAPKKNVPDHFVNTYLAEVDDQGTWQVQQLDQQTSLKVIEGTIQPVNIIHFYAENMERSHFLKRELILDAVSGALISDTNQLNHSMQPGSGYGGNVLTGKKVYAYPENPANATNALDAGTFLVTRSDTTCVMKIEPAAGDWKNNVIIESGESATAPYQYACEDDPATTEVNEELTAFNSENLISTRYAYSPLNDAAYYAQVAYNLYDRFSITEALGPLNSKTKALVVKAHYGASDNSFWNGQFIGLGDGLVYFYPKVAADTLGHELAHAFLGNYSRINQSSGISMGIAESFADIAGEATEYAIRQKSGQSNDWMYAAETFKYSLDTGARYFESPAKDGSSIDSLKHYHSGVVGHYLAGPFNKAFYHLIEDNKNDGWNPIIGYDLWMTAAVNCWVPGLLYESAAQCVVESVKDFRNKNSELPSSWGVKQIEFAVIRAFAEADIMTQADDEDLLVALFDYEPAFDQFHLVNKSSLLPEAGDYTFQWDLQADGLVDEQTTSPDDIVTVDPNTLGSTITVQLVASDQNQSDTYTNELDLSPLYCATSGGNSSADYITQIGINTAQYPVTDAGAGGYSDFTGEDALPVYLNSENTFVLTPNDDSQSRNWVVFIDFNGDHDFSDAGETVLDVKTEGRLTKTLNLDQLTDNNAGKQTRMRVLLNWSSDKSPCSRAAFGEYEDYSVVLTEIRFPDPSFTYAIEKDSYSVTFENTSQNVPDDVTWLWEYRAENENTFTELATTENATKDFGRAGAFIVKLSLTTADSTVYTAEHSIEIEPAGPSIAFHYEIKKGSSVVTFINESAGYDDSAVWQWNYGDGVTLTQNQFIQSHEHTYDTDDMSDNVDEITVTLTVTQNDETDQLQKAISRDQLPEAEGGSLAWAFLLSIWLLLVRVTDPEISLWKSRIKTHSRQKRCKS